MYDDFGVRDRESFDYIEDALASGADDCPTPLTDVELVGGGMAPVRAYVRTQASRNALRVKRCRDKAAAEGLKQVNVTAPAEHHDLIKQLAELLRTGDGIANALDTIKPTDPAEAHAVEIGRRALALRGWRRLAARSLGLL